jgi:hypothetical protein
MTSLKTKEVYMPITVNNEEVEGLSGSLTTTGQDKFQPLPEEQMQEISCSGPIEIRIYEEQDTDNGRMMLKISFANR